MKIKKQSFKNLTINQIIRYSLLNYSLNLGNSYYFFKNNIFYQRNYKRNYKMFFYNFPKNDKRTKGLNIFNLPRTELKRSMALALLNGFHKKMK